MSTYRSYKHNTCTSYGPNKTSFFHWPMQTLLVLDSNIFMDLVVRLLLTP